MIPAFPRPLSVSPIVLESNQHVAFDQQGMTLLDYFAAHFAPSIMEYYCDASFHHADGKEAGRKFVAKESYEWAQAFLDVRNTLRDKSDNHKD